MMRWLEMRIFCGLVVVIVDSKNLCDISDDWGILGFDYREGIAVKEDNLLYAA